MKLISSLMFSMSSMAILMKHPISIGVALTTQTILMTMITGMMNMNFWFSYILFLVMIGGMLILFVYMTSVASNEKFKLNLMLVTAATTTFLTSMLFNKSEMNLSFKIKETLNFNSNNTKTMLTKYFNFPSMTIMMFMMIFLLLTLVVIVKLTKKSMGPIRKNI
uniref:NADH-ubiquinone oxidoreductase chain 6 n=1 Tax=Chalcophana sp. N69 TaxID=2653421 RepID=A0A5Q0U1C0_9CUCU|nr:NADH dehydrogenase subunit 6 [Chalcophana sp. N69]